MNTSRHIAIAGGGLAGLALGIALRQRDISVTLWEAGEYPRHRVCGEFISGCGQLVMERLGLAPLLRDAGAVQVRSARFVAGRNRSPLRTIPPAIGLSRFKLDSILANEFVRLGGQLRSGCRYAGEAAEGVVIASGRRRNAVEGGWHWFGVKAHARNVELEADLEMHAEPNGYVGLSRVDGGKVNVCGLFRSRSGDLRRTRQEWLSGSRGSELSERLARAEWDTASFCSVAGLSLKPHRAADQAELCIGDAVTMIPPVTGNGMSMALESADLAIDPLAAYSRGELTWSRVQQQIAQAYDARFRRRLYWARWLHWMMFSPWVSGPIGRTMMGSEMIWNALFSRTRS